MLNVGLFSCHRSLTGLFHSLPLCRWKAFSALPCFSRPLVYLSANLLCLRVCGLSLFPQLLFTCFPVAHYLSPNDKPSDTSRLAKMASHFILHRALLRHGSIALRLFSPRRQALILLANCKASPVRPNVRAKRETTVWRLARGTDDEAQRPAGQVPRRWLSA